MLISNEVFLKIIEKKYINKNKLFSKHLEAYKKQISL